MPQTITLTLPDSFFQPFKRTALATNQPVEELLVHALQASLPPLEGLPEDFIENLTVLETLSVSSARSHSGVRAAAIQMTSRLFAP